MKKALYLLLALACLLALCGCIRDRTVSAKPVIYLYPEEETRVTVKLDYNGQLTCTYPAYEKGWTVTASPDGTLTREQAVTMLGRVVELVETGAIAKGDAGGLALKKGSKQVTFTDDGAMGGWAKNYVEYFVSHGVIDGMGNGTFAPKNNMTRDQAMKVAVVALGE